MLISKIVRLDKSRHNLKSFDCGIPDVTGFLRRYAVKNMTLNLSNTFVLAYHASDAGQSKTQNIAGFYTLANSSVASNSLPVEHKFPRYPVSVVLLAQFGIDLSVQGQGLGKKLLITALRHANNICVNEQGLPAVGLVLDAIDSEALSFYQSFGFFVPFPADPKRLFVPVQTLAKI